MGVGGMSTDKGWSGPLEGLGKKVDAAVARPAKTLPPEIKEQDDTILELYELHKSEAESLWQKHLKLWREHAR